MSHEIRTQAGNRVYDLLLLDRAEEIEEADILAIEAEVERAVQDDGLPTDSPERRFLLGMVDTLYGGGEKPEDLTARLLVIADVLDKVDAVTDAYVAEKGADHRVGRSFQADLREAASRLRGLPENAELLRRLDAWKESQDPGPLIRWAAAHLRGELGAAPPLHEETTDA